MITDPAIAAIARSVKFMGLRFTVFSSRDSCWGNAVFDSTMTQPAEMHFATRPFFLRSSRWRHGDFPASRVRTRLKIARTSAGPMTKICYESVHYQIDASSTFVSACRRSARRLPLPSRHFLFFTSAETSRGRMRRGLYCVVGRKIPLPSGTRCARACSRRASLGAGTSGTRASAKVVADGKHVCSPVALESTRCRINSV